MNDYQESTEEKPAVGQKQPHLEDLQPKDKAAEETTGGNWGTAPPSRLPGPTPSG